MEPGWLKGSLKKINSFRHWDSEGAVDEIRGHFVIRGSHEGCFLGCDVKKCRLGCEEKK